MSCVSSSSGIWMQYHTSNSKKVGLWASVQSKGFVCAPAFNQKGLGVQLQRSVCAPAFNQKGLFVPRPSIKGVCLWPGLQSKGFGRSIKGVRLCLGVQLQRSVCAWVFNQKVLRLQSKGSVCGPAFNQRSSFVAGHKVGKINFVSGIKRGNKFLNWIRYQFLNGSTR